MVCWASRRGPWLRKWLVTGPLGVRRKVQREEGQERFEIFFGSSLGFHCFGFLISKSICTSVCSDFFLKFSLGVLV